MVFVIISFFILNIETIQKYAKHYRTKNIVRRHYTRVLVKSAI